MILLYIGGIHFIVGKSLNITCNVLSKKLLNKYPEIIYYNHKDPLNTIKTDFVYLIPGFGTYKLITDGINFYKSIKINNYNEEELEESYIEDSYKSKFEQKLKMLKDGKTNYKEIHDSLIIEGLNEKEISKFMKEARKESPYLKENMDNEIEEQSQMERNVQLLDSVKDHIENPEKVYKYTWGKKIETIDLTDKSIEIETSKNGKIRKRTFKNH